MPSKLSPSERRLRAQLAAHARWSREDRGAASARQRRVILRRFENEVDPDGKLSPDERAKRANNAMQSHMSKLALASSRARRDRRSA